MDHNFGFETKRSIAKPSGKMLTHSHSEGHLQVLTPKVIDHSSINKIIDRSLKPLCRCVIQSEAKVIDRNFGAKKRRSIAEPSRKMLTHSHSEDHLQVLTPKMINHTSINKIVDRSL